MRKRHLFVCGCPRSGTTALWKILTSHPEIVLGLERYHHLAFAVGGGGLTPELFSKERFLDVRPGDTFYPSFSVFKHFDEHLQAVEERYDTARWIGDKIPQLSTVLDHVDSRFEDAHIVAILRDPLAVAASYQVRANDRQDMLWGVERNYALAVDEWNLATRRLLDFSRRQDRRSGLTLVSYEDIFRDGANVSALFAELGLDTPEAVRAACSAVLEEAGRLRSLRGAVLTDEQSSLVTKAADIEAADELLRQRLVV